MDKYRIQRAGYLYGNNIKNFITNSKITEYGKFHKQI